MMQSMYDFDLTIKMLAGQAKKNWPKHARTVEPWSGIKTLQCTIDTMDNCSEVLEPQMEYNVFGENVFLHPNQTVVSQKYF